MTDETLIINVPIRRQLLRDLLCTAVEGGSNYWADFSASERTADLDYLRVKVTEQSKSSDKPRVNRYITADDLIRGIERLARATARDDNDDDTRKHFPAAAKHLADVLGDNHDATTADVVLQMTIFGELIYG